MAPSTGDDPTRARREAVQRELRERGDASDGDLVDTVGDEQRRLREADDDEDEDEGA